MTQEERHEVVELLGRIVAGLEVPYSLGRERLGAAAEPWAVLWGKLFQGWQDEEQVIQCLKAALLDE